MAINQQTSSSKISGSRQANASGQTDNALSQPAGGQVDERFSVSEEVSLDQQSDAARRVGHIPEEQPTLKNSGKNPVADALRQSMQKTDEATK